MATTKLTGTLIRSGSIPTTALGGGVFSSSVQLSSALPGGTVSSSAQVQPLLPDGTVSSSTQYPGWVTASSQVQLNNITGTTFSNAAFLFPQNLNVGGTLTAQEIQTEYVTSSIIYESGSTKFGDTADDTHQFTGSLSVLGTISGALILPSGVVTASSQIDITATTNYTTFSSSLSTVDRIQTARIDSLESVTSSYAINSTIQSQLFGVVSSSTQIQPLLPAGTISSSTQVNVILDLDNVVSSSGQVDITATTNYATFSSSIATKNDLQDVSINALNAATSSYAINSTIQGQLAGVISSSTQFNALSNTSASFATTASFALATSGVVQNANTASYVEYANIDGKPTLVSASSQIDITATTNYSTFSSSVATKNDLQDVSINALNAATSSYALQTQLQGVASSSSQVKAYLPDGTVSSSAQFPGLVTSSNQIALSGISGTTFSTGDFTFPSSNLKVTGSLTVLGDISGALLLPAGIVTASSQIVWSSVNYNSGIVSSSGQVQPLLPDGTVSSSTQVTANLPADTVSSSGQVSLTGTNGYSTFSSSIATKNNSQDLTIDIQNISINALNAATSSYALQSQLSGVVSSSAQVQPLLPGGTVSSSAQVKVFLPADTVSSSGQVDITATTNYATFSSSIATKNDLQDVSINALNTATSSYAINSTIQGQLAGVVSSSTQVKPLLPGGTVSSSAQTPIRTFTVTNSGASAYLIDGASNPTLTLIRGFTYNFSVNAAGHPFWIQTVAGAYSSGNIYSTGITNGGAAVGTITFTVPYDAPDTLYYVCQFHSSMAGTITIKDVQPSGLVSSSGQVDITATTNYTTFSSSLATVDQNQQSEINGLKAATGSYAINATIQGQLAGVASSSAQVKAFLPVDTVSSSAQYPGWVTASSQVDITATTNYTTFSSSIATKNDVQDVSIGALNAATSSYAINATIQGQLAGVVSSSTQVKPLLPDGTVSASGQVDITATTNYSTFSSSLATVDAGQTTRIDNLASLTSSYAINATIQGQLAGVASSSAQVKAYLPDGTVSSSGQVDYNSITNKLSGVVSSSTQVQPLLPGGTVSASGQVDITATTGYSTFSSSLATVDAGQTTRIDNLASLTSSYAINATIQGQLAGVVSSSTQVKPLLPDGTVSSSGQVVVQNTTGIGALATTGSNTFTANQTITGSLFISQNLTVLGSSSIGFISQSSLDIGTNIITVNTLSPGTRFGGLSVIDSGSSPKVSGSIFFDSVNDQWLFVHQQAVGAGVTSSLFLQGPQTFDNVGNETNLTTNRIPKSQNAEHLSDSQISDNGVTVSITNGLSVGTNLTASNATISGLTANQAVFTDANDTLVSVATTGTGDVVRAASPTLTGTLSAANITATGTMLLAGIISQSSQVSLTGTTGYSTFSSSIATKNDLQDVSINALNAATSSYAVNATIQGQLAGVVSSSTQVKPLLPGGTVSASGQVDITATTGYSTFSSSLATVDAGQTTRIDNLASLTSSYAINATIQSQLAGVVSSSTQVKPLLPDGTVSSSAQYPGWVTASSQVTITGISGLGANVATFLGTPSSANLATAVTDETGTGALVFAGSPTLTGTVTANNIVMSGSQFSGIVSGSGLQYRLVVPVGTNQYAT